MNARELTFWDVVDRIRESGDAYPREAYGFVVGALGATVEGLPPERLRDPLRRHLSGQELLAGVIALARREFGHLAPAVFAEWGIRSGADIGRIVFQLVGSGQLTARPEDRLEDFLGGPDLVAALREDLDLGSPRA